MLQENVDTRDIGEKESTRDEEGKNSPEACTHQHFKKEGKCSPPHAAVSLLRSHSNLAIRFILTRLIV